MATLQDLFVMDFQASYARLKGGSLTVKAPGLPDYNVAVDFVLDFNAGVFFPAIYADDGNLLLGSSLGALIGARRR